MSDPKPLLRAMVTGGTGFVGSGIIRQLQSAGWDVHALVRSTSDTRELQQQIADERIHVHDSTISSLVESFESAKPDLDRKSVV